jgi:hypothetical protein
VSFRKWPKNCGIVALREMLGVGRNSMQRLSWTNELEKLDATFRVEAKKDRQSAIKIVLLLDDVKLHRLHTKLGYKSLNAFMMEEHHYSKGEAIFRIYANRLISNHPQFREEFCAGNISLTQAYMFQSFFEQEAKVNHLLTPSEQAEIVCELSHLSCEDLKLGLKAYSARQDGEGSDERNSSEEELAQLLVKLKTMEGAKGESDTSVLLALVKEKIMTLEKKMEKSKERPIKNPDSRHIPEGVRVELMVKASGQCEFVSPLNGKRCEAVNHLEVDHRRPLALNGKTEMSNLQVLCGLHNRLKAELDGVGLAKYAGGGEWSVTDHFSSPVFLIENSLDRGSSGGGVCASSEAYFGGEDFGSVERRES